MPYADKERQHEYDRKKYLKNREKVLARSKASYYANLEKNRQYRREYAKKNREKNNAYHRHWRKNLQSSESKAHERKRASEWGKKNLDKLISRNRRYNTKYPIKYIAHVCVKLAIETGLLARPKNCSRCGASGRIEAHHPDYSLMLEVVWLCPICHKSEHLTPTPKSEPQQEER